MLFAALCSVVVMPLQLTVSFRPGVRVLWRCFPECFLTLFLSDLFVLEPRCDQMSHFLYVHVGFEGACEGLCGHCRTRMCDRFGFRIPLFFNRFDGYPVEVFVLPLFPCVSWYPMCYTDASFDPFFGFANGLIKVQIYSSCVFFRIPPPLWRRIYGLIGLPSCLFL